MSKQKEITISSKPKQIEEIIKPHVTEAIIDSTNEFNLGEKIIKRMSLLSPMCNEWSCDFNAVVKIGYSRILDINLKNTKRIWCNFPLQIDDRLFLEIISVYNGSEVEIVNLKDLIDRVNSTYCRICGLEFRACTCNVSYDESHDESHRNENSVHIPVNVAPNEEIDTDPEIHDESNTFKEVISPAEREEREVKHKYLLNQEEERKNAEFESTLNKFQPVIDSVVFTFKFNKTDAMNTAKKIIASNPNITEEELAAEILRNVR